MASRCFGLRPVKISRNRQIRMRQLQRVMNGVTGQ
jgi:hypothetical protein